MKDDSLSEFVIGVVTRSKQEKIREGLKDKLREHGCEYGFGDLNIEDAVDLFLSYLHSVGGVIKVEDWLPVRNGMTCTVESLIEEGNGKGS